MILFQAQKGKQTHHVNSPTKQKNTNKYPSNCTTEGLQDGRKIKLAIETTASNKSAISTSEIAWACLSNSSLKG